MDNSSCPCGSEEKYFSCCGSYHHGEPAESALKLMRSRYSAYVLDLPDYIIATTHPANKFYMENKFAWKRGLSRFSKNSHFQKLEVLDFKEQENFATVTFTAYIRREGLDATFTERSHFEKKQGRWLYRGGRLEAGYAPHLVIEGPLRLLPLAYYGDPVLTQTALPVEEITSDIKQLAEDMISTMRICDGIGIAAPQVHQRRRIFVIESAQGSRVFINPKLSFSAAKECQRAKMREGCLSLPTIDAEIERASEVSVEYINLEGNTLFESFSGLEARIIQHENDHLDGILFLDRLPESQRAAFNIHLEQLRKRINSAS